LKKEVHNEKPPVMQADDETREFLLITIGKF